MAAALAEHLGMIIAGEGSSPAGSFEQPGTTDGGPYNPWRQTDGFRLGGG